LNPLRAFEATSRHLSFTRAAAELGVTQGAVSRAVGSLESHLGIQLFERTGSGLLPVGGSAQFARTVGEAFGRIASAAEALTAYRNDGPVLTVRAYSGFLLRWLVPHLPEFRARHPGIDLRLVSSNDGVDVARGQVDARIRYGRGRWRGVESELLFADELCPVCAPLLLDPAGAPYSPEALRGLVLIHQRHTRGDWGEWLELAGVASLRPRDDLVFEELSVAYEAALAGLGVALGQRRHLHRELATGALFEPFPQVLRRDIGYYLTYEPSRIEAPGFRAFRDWIVEACRD
jgi:LysR family glycine cleavage system transcriptional activator